MSDCDPLDANDDGLFLPEVGEWAQDKKYRLLAAYAGIFATSMKHKWDERVYLDLFAGAGKARLRDSRRIVPSSALLALSARDSFDRYIFCEHDPVRMEALQARVAISASGVPVGYVSDDVNASTEQILSLMPRFSREHTVLTFCFVDPFQLRNLHFATVRALCVYKIDFLVHLPAMDPRRNWEEYSGGSAIVDAFLGDNRWQAEWDPAGGYPFDYFVAEQFAKRMEAMEYRRNAIQESVLVRSSHRNLRLYRLALFTKHALPARFWRDVKRCTDEQGMLFSETNGAEE